MSENEPHNPQTEGPKPEEQKENPTSQLLTDFLAARDEVKSLENLPRPLDYQTFAKLEKAKKVKSHLVNELVKSYEPFIRNQALKFAQKKWRQAESHLEDLIQEVRMGFLLALEKFDPSFGVDITTFAKSGYLKKQLHDYVPKHLLPDSIPASVYWYTELFLKEMSRRKKAPGQLPTPDEKLDLAKKIADKDYLGQILSATSPLRLKQGIVPGIGDDRDVYDLQEVTPSAKNYSHTPEQLTMQAKTDEEIIRHIRQTIPNGELFIRLHGLDGQSEQTLDELAAADGHGQTKQNVGLKTKAAERQIREDMTFHPLRPSLFPETNPSDPKINELIVDITKIICDFYNVRSELMCDPKIDEPRIEAIRIVWYKTILFHLPKLRFMGWESVRSLLKKNAVLKSRKMPQFEQHDLERFSADIPAIDELLYNKFRINPNQ